MQNKKNGILGVTGITGLAAPKRMLTDDQFYTLCQNMICAKYERYDEFLDHCVSHMSNDVVPLFVAPGTLPPWISARIEKKLKRKASHKKRRIQ